MPSRCPCLPFELQIGAQCRDVPSSKQMQHVDLTFISNPTQVILKVSSVAHDGAAARGGILQGDILMSRSPVLLTAGATDELNMAAADGKSGSKGALSSIDLLKFNLCHPSPLS